ncbi:MAG: ATP-dependent Clp protease adapter ClpS [Microthrixaceae bacterium]|nr:ATP-dependent Clp protease adapter ClpS [Microthrixaceae bacterium]
MDSGTISFVSTPVITPSEIVDSELDETIQTDQPWVVLVWNDPINTMDYVALVFQKLFGYSKAKAERLMLQVHNEGRAVVSSGPRDQAEIDVFRLHEHGLWATMQHDK